MNTAIAGASLSGMLNSSSVKESVAKNTINGQFGSVFAGINQLPASSAEGKQLDEQQLKLVQDLLNVLNMGSITESEGGPGFAKTLVMGEGDVTSHPLVSELAESGSLKESIIQLLKQLGIKEEEAGGDDKDITDLSQLVSLILPISQMEIKELANLNFDSLSQVLKLAKLMVLSAEYTDLSSREEGLIKNLDEVLQTVASNLEKEDSLTIKYIDTQSSGNTKRTYNIIHDVFTRMNQGVNLENQKNAGKVSGSELPPAAATFHMPVSKVELLVLSLEKAGQPVSQEQFIKQFENLLAKANFSSIQGTQKLFIRLNPEHLGSLRIEIIQRDSLITAKIIASTSQAKEALENHIQNLKHAFSTQNIGLEKIEISQAMSQYTGERFFQKDHQQQEQQPFEQDIPDEDKPDGTLDFNQSFEEALVTMKV
ncbi:flagellar hook-length control protein FliK [Peribacillus deserti]|uniref:Flagellar hook-length control protein-like C-terminal domain-containing protein n=1 Tax=Peribacillus deserti TaxID=673318 RepID=A0A2N5MB10_9BACI|nr:flagellar hook-length control protein FliK [Peribacillus deserti]PLT31549.1 hypothetical protein CUU66_01450 [Peribacillus deserti]